MDKLKALRYIIYSVLIILIFLLQSSFRLSIFGYKAELLLPFLIAVSMFDGEKAGAVFGLLTGFLADYAADTAVGFHALFYMFACYFAGLLFQSLLRKNILTYMALCALALCAHGMLIFLVFFAAADIPFVSAGAAGNIFIRPLVSAPIPAIYYMFFNLHKKEENIQ